jgi:hypothetical protein
MNFLFQRSKLTYEYLKMDFLLLRRVWNTKSSLFIFSFPCDIHILLLTYWLLYCEILCTNIDPISLLTRGRGMFPRSSLPIFRFVVPLSCIIFPLKPLLCVLCHIFHLLLLLYYPCFLLPLILTSCWQFTSVSFVDQGCHKFILHRYKFS